MLYINIDDFEYCSYNEMENRTRKALGAQKFGRIGNRVKIPNGPATVKRE